MSYNMLDLSMTKSRAIKNQISKPPTFTEVSPKQLSYSDCPLQLWKTAPSMPVHLFQNLSSVASK